MMRKYLKMGLEWIHLLLILSIIVPVIYMISLQREAEQLYRIYAAGYVLLVPIIVLKETAKKCKWFIQYLIVTVCVYLIVKAGAQKLGEILLDETVVSVYTVCINILTILVALQTYALRIYKVLKKKSKEMHDTSWEGTDFILDKPKTNISIWFVGVYFLALNFACPQVCNLALYSTIAYLIIAVAYEYIDKMEDYLKINESLCRVRNIPYKRIFGIGKFFLIGYLCLLLLVSIPAVLTANYRGYHDIRKTEPRKPVAMEQVSHLPQINEDIVKLIQSEVPEESSGEMPVIVNYMFYGFGLVAVVFVLVALIKWVQHELAIFAHASYEDDDIVESLEDSDEIEKVFRSKPVWKKTEEDKIRRLYRKFIRKHRTEHPAAHETPTEIEMAAGVAETQEGKVMHEQYEMARYGPTKI